MKRNKYARVSFEENLLKKIMTYYKTIWAEKKYNSSHHKAWLSNFLTGTVPDERLNSLYLLSKFMFFGQDEVRELLLSLYRDKFKYSVVEDIRQRNSDSLDLTFINSEFQNELIKTRFVGLGKASESGSYLTFHFRAVSKLSTGYFKNESEIFMNGKLSEPDVTRYIFLDDFCGSGETGIKCNTLINEIKKYNSNIKIYYYVLFTTDAGYKNVVAKSKFDNIEYVFLFDKSFKSFELESRYYSVSNPEIDKTFCKVYSIKYGTPLVVDTPIDGHPLGFDDGQLLVAFSHNTPDNTLPIIWGTNNGWKPIFERFIKKHSL